MFKAYKTYFIDILRYHFFDFKGRASRREFWLYGLCWTITLAIIYIPPTIILTNYSSQLSEGVLIAIDNTLNIYLVITLLPYLSILARRYHDMNLSGWMVFAVFIFIFITWVAPYLALLLIISQLLTVLPSHPQPNKWGEVPNMN